MISYPYIILILILSFSSLITIKNQSRDIFKFSCIVIFLFFSLRAPVVGADTYDYVRFFTGERNFYNYDERDLELLFLLYNDLLKIFTDNGVIYLFINSFISLLPLYYLVNKYSERKVLSLFLFFAFGFYISYFVALRQILSISILLWGVICVYENRKYKWVFFMALSVLSYLMHTTAVITTLIYLLAYFFIVKNKKYLYILVIGSVVIGFFSENYSFINIFSIFYSQGLTPIERISNYLTLENFRDEVPLYILLRPTVVGIFVIYFIPDNKINDLLFKIYIFSIILFNLFYQFPMIQRANLSFEIFSIIVFTWIYGSYGGRRLINFKNIFVVFIVLYFTRSFIIASMSPDLDGLSRMHPYFFFFEDYSSHPTITRF